MILGNRALLKAQQNNEIYTSGVFDGIQAPVHLDTQFWAVHTRVDYINVSEYVEWEYFHINNAITLPPNSITLGCTVETVGSRSSSIACMLNTRSTLARYGVAIHTGANIGEPGFCSKWAVELINHTKLPIVVPINAQIGAIYFVRVENSDYIYTGSYMDTWINKNMIPRRIEV
jgi:deoxycytidine triphosphate deaminase